MLKRRKSKKDANINFFCIQYNGDIMIIKYTEKEKELLARLMRAEAVGEGNLGMLMVGNVVVNRALADCLTFRNISTISNVIYQNPGGFEGKNSPLFFSNPTTTEKNLAEKVLKGQYYHPATNALWFYAPGTNQNCTATWWEQQLAGKFKNHCFYQPDSGVCEQLH